MFDQAQQQQQAQSQGNIPIGGPMPNPYYQQPYPPQGGGYMYQGAPQPQHYVPNYLTKEQIENLQKKDNNFSLSLTQEEYERGICNHRTADGSTDTLIADPVTGEVRCSICGYKFLPISRNTADEDIQEDVKRIVDVLQTVKLLYLDLPPEAAKEYFQIIPLINKLPTLFSFAAKNFQKYEGSNWQYNNMNMGAINMLNNLNNMFNGVPNNNNYNNPYGQPQMQYGYQVPPQQQAQYGGPVNYGPSNGFGYPGANVNAYRPDPAVNGFQYNAGQQQTPPTPSNPVTPPEGAATADTKVVTQNVSV